MPESALTSSQLAGRDARVADQDRTLAAMHELEAALGAAAPGRESSWRAAVLAALVVLDEVTDDEYADATAPDSLLSDIKRTQPRLRTRVRGLRTQYGALVRQGGQQSGQALTDVGVVGAVVVGFAQFGAHRRDRLAQMCVLGS